MPDLCIIPAAAVADARLTDADIRVLCAIGRYTNKAGQGAWASAQRIADESTVTRRTFFNSVNRLTEYGYLKRRQRTGETTVYDIRLTPRKAVEKSEGGVNVGSQGECTPVHGGGERRCTGGVNAGSPKRPIERPNERTAAPRARAREPLAAAAPPLHVQLTVAANEAITERFGEQITPLRADGRASELADRFTEVGIPPDEAVLAVRAKAMTLRAPVRSMAYFEQPILELWALEQNRRVMQRAREHGELPPSDTLSWLWAEVHKGGPVPPLPGGMVA